MTDILTRAKEALEGTTEGTWLVVLDQHGHPYLIKNQQRYTCDMLRSPLTPSDRKDWELAVAAPSLVRDLVAEVELLADRIGDLEVENRRLREALEPFSKEASWWFCKNCDASEKIVEGFSDYEGVITCGDLYRARAALEGDKP